MEDKNKIMIFLDDEKQPIASFSAPVNFELDTKKIVDGEHILTIVSKDISGKEGIRKIPFEVRNGPAIAVEGLKDHEKVDGIISLMINAYGKGNQTKFNIEGIETPQSVPTWLWVFIMSFVGWALYYLITNFSL
ncbi:cytochrome C [Flavobacterium polysaccharolyticum]|uniref:Cytochrome C n=1 Tax=Flavobacterium polysaccharolyticum TaxID=3133148 RepID=A0ABU9NJN7_9FLAO